MELATTVSVINIYELLATALQNVHGRDAASLIPQPLILRAVCQYSVQYTLSDYVLVKLDDFT